MNLKQNIFLIDGLGALASMLGTAYLLPLAQPWIGLPTASMLWLAAPAAMFATYSLTCWMLRADPRRWLPPIMAANLGYCVFVFWHLAHHVGVVTPLGWAYFLGEALIVLGLVRVERSIWLGAPSPSPQPLPVPT